MLDSTTLLEAAADNHRAWFRRLATATGGVIERGDDVDLVVDGRGHATIAFPAPGARSRAALDTLLERAFVLGASSTACWSLDEDDELGVLLLARGFEWGWQPHWMAIELSALADDEPGHAVVAVPAEHPSAQRLVVREGEDTVGSVVVLPRRGIAGIYDMEVVERRRREGIGRALMLAAGRIALELGCSYAVLNATEEGEQLYTQVGFESLGWGQTWWMHPGPRPTPRQRELVEAIGSGDLVGLAALDPTGDELAEPVPGPGVPLAVAAVTEQADVAGWILDRRPDLVSRAVGGRGATLLHVAVDRDDEAMVRVALAHDADLLARDRAYNGTPLDWAEFLGRDDLATVLREAAIPSPGATPDQPGSAEGSGAA
ncbi:MAG: GNAT family N-acetyltransferase [Gaiellales bacterium]